MVCFAPGPRSKVSVVKLQMELLSSTDIEAEEQSEKDLSYESISSKHI